MKIAVLSTWYNESAIAPFFLRHYSDWQWDHIRIMLDTSTTDDTAAICAQFPSVLVKPCSMPRGLHELDKVKILQNEFRTMSDYKWIAVLDSDELIFPAQRDIGVHDFLNQFLYAGCVFSYMYPVYRHKTDKDLDASLPAVRQRLHGRQPRANEIKPNVLRYHPEMRLTIGCHTLAQPLDFAEGQFSGAHWADADPTLIVRRLNRRARLSQENLQRGWGIQHFNVTTDSVLAEMAEHENDPLLADLLGREPVKGAKNVRHDKEGSKANTVVPI